MKSQNERCVAFTCVLFEDEARRGGVKARGRGGCDGDAALDGSDESRDVAAVLEVRRVAGVRGGGRCTGRRLLEGRHELCRPRSLSRATTRGVVALWGRRAAASFLERVVADGREEREGHGDDEWARGHGEPNWPAVPVVSVDGAEGREEVRVREREGLGTDQGGALFVSFAFERSKRVRRREERTTRGEMTE